MREDGEVTHDLAEPFKILLSPELSAQLQSLEGQATSRSVTGDGHARSAAVGSNVDLLVDRRESNPWPPPCKGVS